MKVCLCSTDNPYTRSIGGKHIHLLLLERGMKEILGDYNLLTSYYDFTKRTVLDKVKSRLNRLFKGYSYFFLKDSEYINNSMKHITKNIETEVLNAHDVVSLVHFTGKARKRVLTLHGYYAREAINYAQFPENEKDQIKRNLYSVEEEALKKADWVISVDSTIKNYIVQEFNYPQEKISVIPNAIDTDRFVPGEETKVLEMRKALGIGDHNFLILVPRRFVKKNGVLVACQSMKFVQDDRVRMIFIGSGPLEKDLKEESKRDTRIHILGEIPHQRALEYYQSADLVLIPSIISDGVEEATSLSMLEGMSCEKIVLASSIGGLKEVINHMENGILVEQGNPEALANQIAFCVNESTGEAFKKIRENARKCIIAKHSYKQHAARFITVFKKVMD